MNAYWAGLNGKQAAWAPKKYQSHHVLPENILAKFDIAQIWISSRSRTQFAIYPLKFVWEHKLWTTPPHKFHLFNGTSTSVINSCVTLPIQFLTGEILKLNFLIMLIDPSCSTVLRYNWLTCYNPLVDWVRGVSASRHWKKIVELFWPWGSNSQTQTKVHCTRHSINLLMQQCSCQLLNFRNHNSSF